MDENKLFEEVERHLLEDDKPSKYIRSNLYKLKNSNLKIIAELEEIEQNPTHHPEGNVLNHTLLVVDAATIVRVYAHDKRALMWSALFHDLGKKKATKVRKGRITAYDHDAMGAKEAKNILEEYDFLGNKFRENVENMVKYHMHSLYIKRHLPFGNSEQMILDVNMHDMALLFFADKLGRGDFSKKEIQRVISEVIDLLDELEVKHNIDLSGVNKELMELYNMERDFNK